MRTTRHRRTLTACLVAMVLLAVGATALPAGAGKKQFAVARIFFEFNSSANDLGVHVALDGEDWKELRIVNPNGRTIFEVEGSGPYGKLGLTELFFEGAEPNLDEVPLEELLALFPKGTYRFRGTTVEGDAIVGTGRLSHAIPAGPSKVTATLTPPRTLIISWNAVTGPPDGFPDDEPIDIVAYQVIVGAFQVTIPATNAKTFKVTVSPEFVASLGPGPHPFEVLAIDASGNQSITEGAPFTKP